MEHEREQGPTSGGDQDATAHEIHDDALDAVSGGLRIVPDFPLPTPIKPPILTLPIEPIEGTLPISKI